MSCPQGGAVVCCSFGPSRGIAMSRHLYHVLCVFVVASAIVATGELAAQQKAAVPVEQAQAASQKAAGELCNSGNATHAVGQKNPNAWGLYDMHGNVSEWCADWFSYSYQSGAAVDPLGPTSSSIRVNRGGSWIGMAQGCRSASRYGPGPSNRYDNLGFRVARTLSGYAPSAD